MDINYQALKEFELENLRKAFQEQGNPLYVWKAWLACRPDGQCEIPVWVKEYFDVVATNILWETIREDVAPAKDKVFKALGFKPGKGKNDFFKKHEIKKRAIKVAKLASLLHLKKECKTVTKAIEIAAERVGQEDKVSISYETARGWYYKHKNTPPLCAEM